VVSMTRPSQKPRLLLGELIPIALQSEGNPQGDGKAEVVTVHGGLGGEGMGEVLEPHEAPMEPVLVRVLQNGAADERPKHREPVLELDLGGVGVEGGDVEVGGGGRFGRLEG